eukprot:1596744-Alexandrium_andersonii.AAC.1
MSEPGGDVDGGTHQHRAARPRSKAGARPHRIHLSIRWHPRAPGARRARQRHEDELPPCPGS